MLDFATFRINTIDLRPDADQFPYAIWDLEQSSIFDDLRWVIPPLHSWPTVQYVELVAHFVTSIGDQIPKTKWPRYLLLFFVAVAIQNRNKETAWPLLCSSLMNFAFCIYEFFSPIILNFDPLRKSKQILNM